MKTSQSSGWSGAAGVAITLGLTELLAGFSTTIPSPVSSIGAQVVDVSPQWLTEFAIGVFGTADKAVLGIGIVLVAVAIGLALGRASTESPALILTGFGVFAVIGMVAQLAEAGAEPFAVVSSTLTSAAIGLLTWYGIRAWVASGVDVITDGAVPSMERRRLLLAVGGVAAVSVLAVGVGRAKIREKAQAQIAALELPEPVEIVVDPTGENDFGLAGVPSIVVGNASFYRIDTALVVPNVDADEWTLTVKGMVDQEVVLSYQDLLDRPLVERYATLACVSNDVGDTYVGNALWTGIPLTEILDLAGVQAGADQLVGRSVDGWDAGFPTELAYDGREPLIAVGMNREVLPADHGFPARLVVPGLYGYVSATKWLKEIELTTWDAFDGFWIPRGWSKEGPIKTQSRIDRPRRGASVKEGSYTFGGVAWAPTRGISRVEVQLNDGPWRDATLTAPLSANSWVQWAIDLQVGVGTNSLRIRATDGTGETQPEQRTSPRPDGAEGWHTISFVGVRST